MHGTKNSFAIIANCGGYFDRTKWKLGNCRNSILKMSERMSGRIREEINGKECKCDD